MNKKKIVAGLSAGIVIGVGTVATVAQQCATPSGDEINVVYLFIEWPFGI